MNWDRVWSRFQVVCGIFFITFFGATLPMAIFPFGLALLLDLFGCGIGMLLLSVTLELYAQDADLRKEKRFHG